MSLELETFRSRLKAFIFGEHDYMTAHLLLCANLGYINSIIIIIIILFMVQAWNDDDDDDKNWSKYYAKADLELCSQTAVLQWLQVTILATQCPT